MTAGEDERRTARLGGTAARVVVLFALANVGIHHWHARLIEARASNLVGQASTGTTRHDASGGERLGEYWASIPDARACDLAILCGMSQMYWINERQPGDLTISERLDDALAPAGTRVFGLAAPNIANEEVLLLLLATAEDPATRPAKFVFGVCFDKFRNLDVRAGYRRFLRDRPRLLEAWSALAESAAPRYPRAAERMRATLELLRTEAAREGAEEETLEERLRRATATVIPAVAARKELNAWVQRSLYELRNFVFRIDSSTKRPILADRLAINQEFLGLLSDVARARGIELILYVIPLNLAAETPYVGAEYAQFKEWIQRLSRERSIRLANLEDAVPHEHWGQSPLGGPDFKHFKGAGHRVTAEALIEAFGPRLGGEPAPR